MGDRMDERSAPFHRCRTRRGWVRDRCMPAAAAADGPACGSARAAASVGIEWLTTRKASAMAQRCGLVRRGGVEASAGGSEQLVIPEAAPRARHRVRSQVARYSSGSRGTALATGPDGACGPKRSPRERLARIAPSTSPDPVHGYPARRFFFASSDYAAAPDPLQWPGSIPVTYSPLKQGCRTHAQGNSGPTTADRSDPWNDQSQPSRSSISFSLRPPTKLLARRHVDAVGMFEAAHRRRRRG